METTRQQLLHAKLRTLRNTRTGEAHRKAAAMAAEMDVDPMTMMDTLGLTPEEKATVERAASTGSQADVQRALIKTQSKALGLDAASQEATGTGEDTDEDEEAPPPVAPAGPAEPAEIAPRCAQITQRTARRGAKKKAKKRGKRR